MVHFDKKKAKIEYAFQQHSIFKWIIISNEFNQFPFFTLYLFRISFSFTKFETQYSIIIKCCKKYKNVTFYGERDGSLALTTAAECFLDDGI